MNDHLVEPVKKLLPALKLKLLKKILPEKETSLSLDINFLMEILSSSCASLLSINQVVVNSKKYSKSNFTHPALCERVTALFTTNYHIIYDKLPYSAYCPAGEKSWFKF